MPPSLSASYYDLLEVQPGATTEELRQAFRTLSKRYHPDTTSLAPADAAAAFQQLQQSYAVLSDPLSRQRYDAEHLALDAMVLAQAPPSLALDSIAIGAASPGGHTEAPVRRRVVGTFTVGVHIAAEFGPRHWPGLAPGRGLRWPFNQHKKR